MSNAQYSIFKAERELGLIGWGRIIDEESNITIEQGISNDKCMANH
jgi:hypothetical protein